MSQRKHRTPMPSQASDKPRLEHRLIAGMTEGEVDDFLVRWAASRAVREQCRKVLTDELENVIINTEKEEWLNLPNLSERIAYTNGVRHTLRDIIKLLTQQDKP